MKPEVVYAPLEYNVGTFVTQLSQARLGIPVMTSDLITQDVLGSVGDAAEGIYQSQTDELRAPLTGHLRQLYRKTFGRDPELIQFNAWGYDGVRVVAEAAKQGAATPEKVARALYTIKDFPGASAVLSISPGGSSPTFESIYQVRKRKFVRVE